MIDRLKTQENLEIKINKLISLLFLYMIILLINYI